MRLGIGEMPKRSSLVYRALQDITPGHSEGIGQRMTGIPGLMGRRRGEVQAGSG
jgi:hypothetical protein